VHDVSAKGDWQVSPPLHTIRNWLYFVGWLSELKRSAIRLGQKLLKIFLKFGGVFPSNVPGKTLAVLEGT